MRRSLGALLVLALGACSGSSSSPTPGGFHASERVHFQSLPEMVATADLVVVATIKTVAPGRTTIISPNDRVPHLQTTLLVEETLKGPDGFTGTEIPVSSLEAAYKPPHTEWRRVGQRVVAFLDYSPEGNPWFITTNWSQSVYLLSKEDLSAVVRIEAAEKLIPAIAALSFSQLKQEVGKAKQMIAEGKVTPKPKPTEPDPTPDE